MQETLDLSNAGITCRGAQYLQQLEGHRKLKHLCDTRHFPVLHHHPVFVCTAYVWLSDAG